MKPPRRLRLQTLRERIVEAAFDLADSDAEARRLFHEHGRRCREVSRARRRRVEMRDRVAHFARVLRERLEEEGGS